MEEVALNMEETLYGPGEIIFKKGETDKKIFFIVKGSVELYMETPHEKETQTNIFKKEVQTPYFHQVMDQTQDHRLNHQFHQLHQ